MSTPFAPSVWMIQVAKPFVYAWTFVDTLAHGIVRAFRDACFEVRIERDSAHAWTQRSRLMRKLGL